MLRLALPVLAEQMLTMLVGYTDWWLTGHFLEGTAPQAAIGLIAYILWLLPSLFAAVAIGATAMIARFVGAGDPPMANRVAQQAMLVGMLLAVFATLAVALWGPTFVKAMQLKEDAAVLAAGYLWILVPVIPAIMVEQVGVACLHGVGDTVSGFVAKTIVNVLNVVISAGLVTGWGPFPDWGWYGLAFGTACGHGIGGLIILALLLKGRAGLRLSRQVFTPDPLLIRRLTRVGWPGGVDVMTVLFCHLVFVAVINSLGTLAAAAHGLGVLIESAAYLPGSAFQVAAGTLAGQCLGAGQPRRAARSMLLACLVGGGLMVVAGLAFYFGAELLTAFFTGSRASETAQATVPLLRVVALTMPFLALTMILSGGLRGAGDTRWPLRITLIGFFGIRIPVSCLLAWHTVDLPFVSYSIPGLGLGVLGAWYAMAADVALRGFLFLARFFHGSWKHIKV